MVEAGSEGDEVMDNKRVLITGGGGNLGKALLQEFPGAMAPSHKQMDICNYRQVMTVFDLFKPELVIHAAAMTDIRECESDWMRADLVNIGGTNNIVHAANNADAKIIHISTACVFGGETDAPYDEFSKPEPKNHYALTKYVSEEIVQVRAEDSLIVRTNFVPRQVWKYPAAFTDRFGSYLYADDVAHALRTLRWRKGIIHICGDQKMSMFELAKRTTPDVKPMTMADYRGPALTRDMTLVSKIIKPFKIGAYPFKGEE